MGKIKLLILFLAAVTAGLCADVEIGMKETDVLEYMGKPSSKATMGNKTIYRWPDMIVTMRRGFVVSVKIRDLEAERVEEERRQRVVEETKAKEAAWLAAHPPKPDTTPATSPTPKTQLEISQARVERAQKILGLRQAIDAQRAVVELYSRGFSSPRYGGGSTAAQRDLAAALISRYEAEIQALEQTPY